MLIKPVKEECSLYLNLACCIAGARQRCGPCSWPPRVWRTPRAHTSASAATLHGAPSPSTFWRRTTLSTSRSWLAAMRVSVAAGAYAKSPIRPMGYVVWSNIRANCPIRYMRVFLNRCSSIIIGHLVALRRGHHQGAAGGALPAGWPLLRRGSCGGDRAGTRVVGPSRGTPTGALATCVSEVSLRTFAVTCP